MANKFAQLRSRMSPEAQARSAVKAQKMLAEMPLNELRQAREISQKVLADVLHVQQPSLAKLPGGHPKSPSDGHFKIPQ